MRFVFTLLLFLSVSLTTFAQGFSGSINQSKYLRVVSKTTTYTATLSNDVILADTASGAWTLTFPAASLAKGKVWRIKKISTADANALTISVTVDGVATPKIYAPNETWVITSDGTAYYAIEKFFEPKQVELYLDTGNGHGSTNTKVRRFTNSRKDSLAPYATYADSAGNGASVTINIPGNYYVGYSDVQSGSFEEMGITVNGSALTTNIDTVTYAQGKRVYCEASATASDFCSVLLRLEVGDVVRPQDNGQADGADSSVIFSVTRVSP